MTKIEQTLKKFFESKRVVFWYDEDGKLRERYDELLLEDVEKLEIDNNEFGIKYQVRTNPEQKYLIYAPFKKPDDDDNWLLDLLLDGEEFCADEISLALSELGLDVSFKEVAQKYSKFFHAKNRVEKLKSILEGEDEKSLVLKMMSVTLNSAPILNEITLKTITNPKSLEELEKLGLEDALWSELGNAYGYRSEKRSIKDFTYKLLQNHLYRTTKIEHPPLNNEAMLFVKSWMDSRIYGESYKEIASKCADELNIASMIEKIDVQKLLECDTYEVCEQMIITNLKNRALSEDIRIEELEQMIEKREHKFWFSRYANIYQALLFGYRMIVAIRDGGLKSESFEGGVREYAKRWHKIDLYYRKYALHSRNAEHNTILKELDNKIEDFYINGFLRTLNDDFAKHLDGYEKSGINRARGFWEQIIEPHLRKDEYVFVIVSDALRYECGVELAQKIERIQRYNTEVTHLLSTLPSITKLGMASLLPHKTLEIKEKSDDVFVDGKMSSGIDARSKILQERVKESIALSDEEFLRFNTDSGREFAKQYRVVYIFHDAIDATGDKAASEERVFEAVESAFVTIEKIIKQISNLNRNNIYITSDHGFLFHNRATEESAFCKYDGVMEPMKFNRRFIIGKELKESNCGKMFSSSELGIEGENEFLLATSINKFRIQGGGHRFVHGGATLQEMVIPLISIRKQRSDNTRPVEVEVMAIPKITTNSINISLYQREACSEKVYPLSLKVAFYSSDGELLSQVHTVSFDSSEEESRSREKRLRFDFRQNVNRYNNQTIKLILKKVVPNSTEDAHYKEVDATLKLSFFNEFDGF